MRPFSRAIAGLALAGALAIGCNSLVGNDAHELGPGDVGGTTGAKGGTNGGFMPTGGSSGAAGGANGGTVATGGMPAAGGGPAGGGPGVGGTTGNGGAATGGATANGGAAAGGHLGSGGVVATGGVPATGGVTGSGGVHGNGGAVASGGSGMAGAGGMCIEPGGTCTVSSGCCQTSSGTPMGAVCITDDNVCHAKCASGTQCVSGCCASVTGQSYGVCADAATYCPALKGVGDPCAADSECASGSCNDWCQATCASGNSTCSSTTSRLLNSRGEPNWCVFTQASTYSCFPGCVTNADCTVYGTGYTCQTVTDVDGLTDNVCSL